MDDPAVRLRMNDEYEWVWSLYSVGGELLCRSTQAFFTLAEAKTAFLRAQKSFGSMAA